jgi:hypothetical protein
LSWYVGGIYIPLFVFLEYPLSFGHRRLTLSEAVGPVDFITTGTSA